MNETLQNIRARLTALEQSSRAFYTANRVMVLGGITIMSLLLIVWARLGFTLQVSQFFASGVADVVLTAQPSQATVVANGTFTVAVNIDTKTSQVAGAELHLTFPSDKLQAISIEAGPFLPTVLTPGAVGAGTASIVLGSGTSPKQGTGSLATITFRALAAGSAQVAFAASTQIAAAGQAANALATAAPTTVTVSGVAAPVVGAPVDIYRLYLVSIKDHLLTADVNQYNTLGAGGWTKEGVNFRAWSTAGTYQGVAVVPMHGLYNAALQQHLYSTDTNEYGAVLPTQGWLDQGTAAYILPTQVAGTVPLYRLAITTTPVHFLTTADGAEKNTRVSQGWINQGILGYVLPSTTIATPPPALTNNAVCVSVTGVPATIAPGGTFTAQITTRNTGTTTWTLDATPHGLSSVDPDDNAVWRPGRIPLSAASVAPGQETTFTIDATAPATPGTHTFHWRMVEDGVERFGGVCGGSVEVTTVQTPTPSPTPTATPTSTLTLSVTPGAITCTGSPGTVLSWTAVAGADHYAVGRSTTSGGPYTTLANVPNTATTYTDSPPQAGTVYYVVNAWMAGSGANVTSNQVSTTITPASCQTPVFPTPTSTPTVYLPETLTCAANGSSVVVGQAVLVTAFGGTGGNHKWTLSPDGNITTGGCVTGVGQSCIEATFNSPGSKTASVTNSAGQTASCGVQVVAASGTPPPSTAQSGIAVTGRNVSTASVESSTVSALGGQQVEVIARVTNSGSTILGHTVVQAPLSNGLVYVTGSTSVNGTPTAVDSITTSGLALDGLGPNQAAVVRFRVRITGSAFPAGQSQALLIVHATSEGAPARSAQLTIIVNRSTAPVGAVQTGPGEAVGMALLVSAVMTLLYVSYTHTSAFRRREVDVITQSRDPMDFRS